MTIFEKGIKPVKANKFYYFKHPMAREMQRLEISHNDIGEIDRGTWRKYNPYNPYVEGNDEKATQNLDIESLDDLFEESSSDKVDNNKIDNVPDLENLEENKSAPVIDNNLLDLDLDDAPVFPQEDEDTYDLQKELEAKFDELFGPLDDN